MQRHRQAIPGPNSVLLILSHHLIETCLGNIIRGTAQGGFGEGIMLYMCEMSCVCGGGLLYTRIFDLKRIQVRLEREEMQEFKAKCERQIK